MNLYNRITSSIERKEGCYWAKIMSNGKGQFVMAASIIIQSADWERVTYFHIRLGKHPLQ